MTLNDLDTWCVMYSVFTGDDVEYGIHFVSLTVITMIRIGKNRIVTAKMSHEEDPWHA